MALFATTETRKLFLPTDLPGVTEGEWVEIAIGYSGGVRRRIGNRYQAYHPDLPFDYNSYKQACLEEIVKGWSSPEAVSPDTITDLDARIQDYLVEQYDSLSQGRDDESKNLSDSSSNPGLEPVAASSRQSSDI